MRIQGTGAIILTPEQRERSRIYNEKLLRMPADKAADIILRGVAKNKPRILVGNDAKALDLLVRLLPRHYPQLAAWVTKRMFVSPH